MSKTKYIAVKNLPIRPWTIPTIAIVACLKAFEASRTVWAVLITIIVVIWIILLVGIFTTETVELDMEKLERDYGKRS